MRAETLPFEKALKKIKRTIAGLGLVALGVMGAAKWGWPWFATMPLAVVGATVWAGEIITLPVEWAVGQVKRLRNGKK